MLIRIIINFVHCEFKKIKTNLTMFLIFFWIIWFSQIIAISTLFMSLPNIITDIPAVTVTELPLEVLQPMQDGLNAIAVDASNKKSKSQDSENRTVDILVHKNEEIPKDGEIIKINDSGGVDSHTAEQSELPVKTIESSTMLGDIEKENITLSASPSPVQDSDQQIKNASTTATVNLTHEEIPMPVFSEWAQKQMEAAEKQQQAKEQEVVNTITQKKNLTNGSKKLPPLKMRAKNYASPDCGAKIIASNADASNTGAVLSSSKDEYMLSPCGNRIWFVVELCEAIQAQKVDLANFELFSSSPKNFTVAVANRFPTRDWSNVGRFIAEDKRTVQSFDLHPHLFGKFVRVDIHSHYSQEHFCPVSLFRVYGTSEIEAFETENHPDDDLDDFDDEFENVAVEQQQANKNSDNIFKSASDAVLSIVKKAAEVLVKPSNNRNQSSDNQTSLSAYSLCRSSINGPFSCKTCSANLVERINNVLSCEFHQLENLLAIKSLRNDLLNTQVCIKKFGINAEYLNSDCDIMKNEFQQYDLKKSYFLNILPEEYIGALCYTFTGLAATRNDFIASSITNDKSNEMTLNLTIDKKLKANEFETEKSPMKKITKTMKDNLHKRSIESEEQQAIEQSLVTGESLEEITTTEPSIIATTNVEEEQQNRPPTQNELPLVETTTLPSIELQTSSSSEVPPPSPDVNIYNMPVNSKESENLITQNENGNDEAKIIGENIEELSNESIPVTSTEVPLKNDDDTANVSWDGLESLLPPAIPPNDNNIIVNQNNQINFNLQQKIPGGPQSESIYMRLSNRIKTLERNMSLSGQYLEELSRRYKKQVEELQQILTQQSQTVRNLEEQNRRNVEMQQLYEQSTILLKNELDNMALQVHACIIVIIVVGGFVLLLLVVSIVFYRAIWRRSKTLTIPQESKSYGKKKNTNNQSCNTKKLPRRKSFDEYSDHSTEKLRRPSEEAMDILKNHMDVTENQQTIVDKVIQTQPQRKISICYGSNPNENILKRESLLLKNKNLSKRKGAKNSWSNPGDTNQFPWEHLEKLRGMDITLDEYKQIAEAEKNRKFKLRTSFSNQQTNGQGKSKKKLQNLRRQESAPAQCVNNGSNLNSLENTLLDSYDEKLMLDEEDLDNFIPNSDLAYNEFMPEGPSGYQMVVDENDTTPDGGSEHLLLTTTTTNNNNNNKRNDKCGKKKSRLISSQGFFKSLKPKSLSINSNGSSNSASNTPHGKATSWEWHRLKNNDQNSSHSAGELRYSPTGSLDASTLSEIHFPTNSNENPFRILEKAILSSENAVDHSPTSITNNGKKSFSATSSVSDGSSSQRSSISNSTNSSSTTTTKKKQSGLNRIFRKVF